MKIKRTISKKVDFLGTNFNSLLISDLEITSTKVKQLLKVFLTVTGGSHFMPRLDLNTNQRQPITVNVKLFYISVFRSLVGLCL